MPPDVLAHEVIQRNTQPDCPENRQPPKARHGSQAVTDGHRPPFGDSDRRYQPCDDGCDHGPSDSSLENARSRSSKEQAAKGDEEGIDAQVAEPIEPPHLSR
jgi:hypothetical protein